MLNRSDIRISNPQHTYKEWPCVFASADFPIGFSHILHIIVEPAIIPDTQDLPNKYLLNQFLRIRLEKKRGRKTK